MEHQRLTAVTLDIPAKAVVAGLATVIGVGTTITRDDQAVTLPLVGALVAVFWGWALIATFPVWLVHIAGIAVPLALNLIENFDEVSMFFTVLVIALLAATEHRRNLVAAMTIATMVLFFVLAISGALNGFGWPNWVFGLGFSWGFGEMNYRLATTIRELESTRAIVADQAALRERRRIARDVHDLVGHSLTVVLLHLTGARHLIDKDPAEAKRGLEQAESACRNSLSDIRRTVGLLRDEDDRTTAATPSPTLIDIQSLVTEFSDAGLDVSYEAVGEIDKVESASALAGYRIVQEALTNASRHTSGAVVTVALTVDETSYDVVVNNSGGSVAKHSEPGGFGLTSMRERAKSVGGSLITGPTSQGWTVEASLPIDTGVVA